MKTITALILTYNESKHLQRCIDSIKPLCSDIVIVDSFSTDNTKDIALDNGVRFFSNEWVNYAKQFNWGLDNCDISTDLTMRFDADEVMTKSLADEILNELRIDDSLDTFFLNRGHVFLNKKMLHGSSFPIKLLRIWKTGNGYCQDKWMDEHIILRGDNVSKTMKSAFWDHNLNNLTWWVDKHNKYAVREAADIIIRMEREVVSSEQVSVKLVFKYKVYENLPLSLRSLMYFIYRYFFRLGFLDSYQGLVWHVLQGFWYRFLVDVKVFEIINKSKTDCVSVHDILENDYGIIIDSRIDKI